ITPKMLTGDLAMTKVFDYSVVIAASSIDERGSFNQTLADMVLEGDYIAIVANMSDFGVYDRETGEKSTLSQYSKPELRGDDKGNYDISKLNITGEILPKTLTMPDITSFTKEYDGTTKVVYNFTTDDGLISGTNCALTFEVKETIGKNVGEYTNLSVNDATTALSNKSYKVNFSNSLIFTDESVKLSLTITQKVIKERNIVLKETALAGKTSIDTVIKIQLDPNDETKTEDVAITLTPYSESEWNHAGELTLVLEKQITGQVKIEIKSDTNYKFAYNFIGILIIAA
ncbi:MAG: hypothetical protein ACI4TT_03500, partial [Christensenellales bacterium]